METFEVKIINPKATMVLKGLEEMKLISLKESGSSTSSELKKRKSSAGLKDKKEDTYPFRPQYLTFDGKSYVLTKKLDCTVSFEEYQYIIVNDLLNIAVWGNTRDEAEEAFAFTFHSLHQNFALESDENLTTKARKLKQTLKKLILSHS